jgi:hypothetical protein
MVQITPENYDFLLAERPPPISLFVVDNTTHALQLRHPNEQPRPTFILSVVSGNKDGSFPGGPEPYLQPAASKGLPSAMQSKAPAMQPLAFHLRTSSVCVRVRNLLRVPLFELETAEIQVDCDMDSSLMRATTNCSPEAWSYNAALKEWEPMIEKFPVKV